MAAEGSEGTAAETVEGSHLDSQDREAHWE